MNALPAKPDVSVIIPVYNRREVITRAVESLLKQDFERSYEIVVVDDGSTDGTAEQIEGISPIVRVIRQQNTGAAQARHQGIAAAHADVVAFLDSDDFALPNHLQALWDGLHRRDDVVLAYGSAQRLDGRPIKPATSPTELADFDSERILVTPFVSLLRAGCFVPNMNLMTGRQLAYQASQGRKHIVAANDYDLLLRIAPKGSFAHVPEAIVQVDADRSDSISTRHRARQNPFSLLVAVEAYRNTVRPDALTKSALANRAGMMWMAAATLAARGGEPALAVKTAWNGLRYGGVYRTVRTLYWKLSAFFTLNKRG